LSQHAPQERKSDLASQLRTTDIMRHILSLAFSYIPKDVRSLARPVDRDFSSDFEGAFVCLCVCVCVFVCSCGALFG
jgi:hypothetical protein